MHLPQRIGSVLASGCLLFAALSVGPCACAPTGTAAPELGREPARVEPPGPVHHVVLVTIDGLLPDSYLHPDAHGLRIPTLRALAARGATSDGALSVFPTLTYPSHTSMVTGVDPGKHGIVANRSFDPYENDLEGWRWYAEDIARDPIWRVAERAGYRVGMVHWPVSVGARVTWLVPEYWRAKNDEDQKLLRAVSTPGLLEAVAAKHPDFWSRFPPPHVHDDALTDIATHILETGRPSLLLVHLVGVDGAQHAHGVWSQEATVAIEDVDHQLARIFGVLRDTGLAADTNVIVASDHGFMDASSMVRPGVLLREAGLTTLNGEGRVVEWKATTIVNSGQAYIYVHDPNDAATKAKVRSIFDAKLHEEGSGIGRVYAEDEIRSKGGDPRAFLAVEATKGYQLGGGSVGAYVAPPMYRATHGYDPSRPEMRASLLLVGPTIPHGSIPNARLVDIAPTIAEWMHLPLGAVDGTPLHVVAAR